MTILVTGSSGHLGEALMRLMQAEGRAAEGLDIAQGPFTQHLGSVADAETVKRAMTGKRAVLHTATLHKPHVATHSKTAFVETNVTGTLTLLEAAIEAGVESLIFTSTTSAFGSALTPAPDAPAIWIDRFFPGTPKNIYGVTKEAAESLCELFHRRHGLPVLVLRTARFFPEPDDDPVRRAAFADENAKANEFLNRRLDVEDAARAHLLALDRATGFDRFILSATTPLRPEDTAALRKDAPSVIARRVPQAAEIYAARGYRLPDSLDRVYDNNRARQALDWTPKYHFARILAQLDAGEPIGSPLSRQVGIKGYHGEDFSDGLYPVD